MYVRMQENKVTRGLPPLTIRYRNMKKETYKKEDWFIRFLNIFMMHAAYWLIIALLIRYINTHG